MKTEFVVYDAVCGSGKTERVMDYMVSNSDEKFIYITPFLSECHRIAATKPVDEGVDDAPEIDMLTGLPKYDTSVRTHKLRFKHPDRKKGKGRKETSLAYLMSKGENIVGTHQLFTHMGIDSLDGADQYTLLVDEALSVYEENDDISRAEVQKLLKIGILYLDEDGITLRFDRAAFGRSQNNDEDSVKDTSYERLAAMCDLSQLMLIDGKTIVWEMSAEMLKKFKKVIICTFLFEGQLFASYLRKHNIPYTVEKWGKTGEELVGLFDVLDNKVLNSLGISETALSKSYFTKSATKEGAREACRKNLHTAMTNWKAKSTDRIFTCFKADLPYISNKSRYKKQWLPFNCRATNNYSDVHHVAYLVNVYPSPILVKASANKETDLDTDLYALGEMLQFLFRSAIRKGEKCKFYIPSSRMRHLLFKYLNGDFD